MTEFTLGLEEEIFVCHSDSGDLVRYPSDALMATVQRNLHGRVSLESIRSQFELKTPICQDIAHLGAEVLKFRREIVQLAAEFDLGILSAGVHPAAKWAFVSRHNRMEIVERANDYGLLYFRGLTGAFHLHVGIADDDARTEMAWLAAPFVPLMIALSANSPIYDSCDTQLMSYRLAMLNSRPRSGFFPRLHGFQEYMDTREALTGVLRALSPFSEPTANYRFLGYVRPSHRYPTLEFRLFDGTPFLSDLIPVLALTQSLVHAMVIHRDFFRAYRSDFSDDMLAYNADQALMNGVEAQFMLPDDKGRRHVVVTSEWLEQTINRLMPSARDLGCAEAFLACRRLVLANRAAQRQRGVYQSCLDQGLSTEDAARSVAKDLIFAFET